MLNNLIDSHAIFADLVTTIGFLYLLARGVRGKIWLSSLNYRLDTGMSIEIHIRKYLTSNMWGGAIYSISKI